MKCSILLHLAAYAAITSRIVAETSDSSWLTEAQFPHQDRGLQRRVAEVYECDENLEAVSETVEKELKPRGSEIRVCFQPQRTTLGSDIFMGSIDDFMWYQPSTGVSQRAVRYKSDLTGSLAICIQGAVKCSLKTKLIDDFFWGSGNATVVGGGTVSLWTDDDGTHDGFAGSHAIDTDIFVQLSPKPDDLPDTNGDTTSWWDDAPSWLRALIIMLGALIVLMVCCLCCMCAFAGSILDRRKVDRTSKNDEFEPAHNVEFRPPMRYSQDCEEDDYPEARESSKFYQPSKDYTPPTGEDVCFGDEDHAGTLAMKKAVQKTYDKLGDVEYEPSVYRHIKKQLPGRRFFAPEEDDDAPHDWREITKLELVDQLEREYEGVKAFNARDTSVVET